MLLETIFTTFSSKKAATNIFTRLVNRVNKGKNIYNKPTKQHKFVINNISNSTSLL